MTFAQPWALWLAASFLAASALGLWGAANNARDLERFLSAKAIERLSNAPSRGDRFRSLYLLIAAVAMALIALARPQLGLEYERIQWRGMDILFLIDTSHSMAARDAAPNRFGAAMGEVRKLMASFPGSRFGIVTFAGRSYLECPLTWDESVVRFFLDDVRAGLVPAKGTNIAEALKLAVDELSAGGAQSKVAVLLSDGENLSGDIKEAAAFAAREGITVFSAGTGTRAGARIPMRGPPGGATEYKRNRSGKVIVSRLRMEALEEISRMTGGAAYALVNGETGADDLILRIKEMAKEKITTVHGAELGIETHQSFALLALLFLFLEYLFYSAPKPPRMVS